MSKSNHFCNPARSFGSRRLEIVDIKNSIKSRASFGLGKIGRIESKRDLFWQAAANCMPYPLQLRPTHFLVLDEISPQRNADAISLWTTSDRHRRCARHQLIRGGGRHRQ